MTTSPNCVGYKQDTCVFPTPCPECHVCPPSLCECLFQLASGHKDVHLSDRLVCVGGGHTFIGLNKAPSREHFADELCGSLNDSAATVPWRLEMTHWVELRTPGPGAWGQTHIKYVPYRPWAPVPEWGEHQTDLICAPVTDCGKVTEFLQASVCLSITQGK